jgi:GntR family transcriptional regulator/MocR family aminotransferase
LAKNETSKTTELLLSVERGGGRRLGAQIEAQLRDAIRSGQLRAGTPVPSTRDLARQLDVSRRIVVDAYAQLGAEGYLSLRQGARPSVNPGFELPTPAPARTAAGAPPRVRHDFQPSAPDVAPFPRAAWLRCVRAAVERMTDAELGYVDPCGIEALRGALADYLGRVRGVVAEPARVVVTSGYSQALSLTSRVLAERGARRIALEDPCDPEYHVICARAGLEPVPVPVDGAGLVVDALARAGVDAVVVTPAHQSPTGAVLARERRTALLAWLRETDALAIEDDYDAEYRYDRAAVGALQALEPEHVVYAGTASKTLAPGLRMGWLVVPGRLVAPLRQEKRLADRGTPHIDQRAFAEFLARGELDRHLRRMRLLYRGRRDALVAALAEELPDATVHGIAAGMHAVVELAPDDDEDAIREAAAARRIRFETLRDYGRGDDGAPVLLLGYGQISEPAIPAGVRALAEAVHAARAAALTRSPAGRSPRRGPSR